MNAIIGIEKQTVSCLIGCHPDEWKILQELIIDLKIEVSIDDCVASDNIKDAANYIVLSDIITQIATQQPHHLLETLSHKIIQKTVEVFNPFTIWLKIRKKPKILPNIEFSTVEITWKKT